MNTLVRELRHGARSLMRDRAFTFTVGVTLAVCIGINAITLAIVNSVLLRPLPVSGADSLLLMSNRYPKAGAGDLNQSSVGDYYDRLRETDVFEEQALFDFASLTVQVEGTPELVRGVWGTPSLFRLLRVQPALGRAFTEEEGEPGGEQKVILSHALWQRLYGGDTSVLGRELRMSGRPYTIVGVMPRDFVFLDPDARLWVPTAFTAEQKEARHSNNWYHLGRLKPGATLEQAQSQVDAVNAANLERFPQWREILTNAGFHTHVQRLQDMVVRDVRGILYLLWGGAMFVLFIGVLNIANLALARLRTRRKEIATRLALGATRAQILRQMVAENALLTTVSGMAGLGLGYALLRVMTTAGLGQLPRAHEIQLDTFVALSSVVMAAGIGVLIGFVSLSQAFRVELANVLHEDARTGSAGRGARRVRQSLVIAQVALAFVLLVGAGLLLASFQQLLRTDPGFSSDGVLTASLSAPRGRYPDAASLRALMNRSLESVRRIPGVTLAGATSTIPFSGDYSDSVVIPEGMVVKPGESLLSPRQVTVTPGYTEAMRIPLLAGRTFQERDNESAPLAVIVDQRLAARFWPDQDPIGRRMFMPEGPDDVFKTGENTRWLTVVGVVSDVRLENLDGTGSPVGAYYLPCAQWPTRGFTVAARTSGDPMGLANSLRASIASIDPELALVGVRTMAERTELSLSSRRTSLTLATGFGALAMFLSAIGIYGVLAYNVSQRVREFGIRMAVGSTPGGILRLVLREGLALVGVGLVLGLGGAAAMAGLVQSELYGVGALDPFVLGCVMAVLSFVAFAACWIPAHRATRVDPMVALRYE
ncbi:MAG TPA: ABC transporter permease [Candidatus Acidoferrales bacterium]